MGIFQPLSFRKTVARFGAEPTGMCQKADKKLPDADGGEIYKLAPVAECQTSTLPAAGFKPIFEI